MCTRQDDKPLVEVNWKGEHMKGKPLSSIYLLDHSSRTQADYLEVLKRNPNLISQFVAKLSKTFHARLLSVHKDPLTLVLCHRTADDFRYLTENRRALIELIRELIPHQHTAGRLELKVSFHGGEGDTKYGGRSKRLMDTGKHYRNRTLSELSFEAEIGQGLECISKKLSKQRENFDSRLQSQNDKLEIVKKEIDKISQHMHRQLNERQTGTRGDRATPSVNHYLSTAEQTLTHSKQSSNLKKQSLILQKRSSTHNTQLSFNGNKLSTHSKRSLSNGKPCFAKESPSLSKGKQSISLERSRTSGDKESPSFDHPMPTGEEISFKGKQPSSHEKEPMSNEKQSSTQEIESSFPDNSISSDRHLDNRKYCMQNTQPVQLVNQDDQENGFKDIANNSCDNDDDSDDCKDDIDDHHEGKESIGDENTDSGDDKEGIDDNNDSADFKEGMDDDKNDSGDDKEGNHDDNSDSGDSKEGMDDYNSDSGDSKEGIDDDNSDSGDSKEGIDDDNSDSGDSKEGIDDDNSDSGDSKEGIDDYNSDNCDGEEDEVYNNGDESHEGKEDVIDELQKAVEDLIQRRVRGEDTCSTPGTPDPYSFRSNSGLFTSPSKLEHVLLRMDMDVTKETHPKLEVEHAAICVLNHFRDVIFPNVDDRTWQMVDLVIENEPTPVPRSETSFDTILCLDNFGIMSRENFSRLKEIALDFVNGIEDITDEYGLEENIAVVALGSSPQILHHLSIDYNSIRETIDNLECGRFESLAYLNGVLMSLAASTRGGVCDLGGYLRVPPRLVVITDGVVLGKTEGCKTQMETATTFEAFNQLQFPFIRQNIFGDVILVPNGPVNENMLKIYIKKCKGRLVNDIASLCNNQRLKRHAAQILKYIDSQCGSNRSTATNLLQILNAFTAGFTQTEKSEIVNIVKERYDPEVPTTYSIYSYKNIHEESTLPPLGSRVIRGPDWPGMDEDGNGPGTVINHQRDKVNLWVLWDNFVTCIYRYGLGYYDVCPVEDQPMLPHESDLVLLIGMQVERGPDWHESYGDQDGGPGSFGTVIRYNYLRVMVRWNNGEMHEYRFGENGRYDLIIRSCYDKVKDYKTGSKKNVSGAGSRPKYATHDTTERRQKKKEVHSNTTSSQYTPTRWYWQDPGGSWIPYNPGDNEKLIKTYTRRPDGSCLIQRGGITCRIFFKTLEEKPIDGTKGGDSRNVRFE